MSNDDFFIEDIIGNLEKKKKKKKVNSGDKGKRGERELCKLLNEHFPGDESFFRVVGSGNRWAQVTLSQHAQEVLTSDVVCPKKFLFSVECKYGYDDVELCSIFEGGHKQIDEFLDKTERDANKVKKQPLLCWKKPHYPWLAFVKADLPDNFEFMAKYKDWKVVSLREMLKLGREFFFSL